MDSSSGHPVESDTAIERLRSATTHSSSGVPHSCKHCSSTILRPSDQDYMRAKIWQRYKWWYTLPHTMEAAQVAADSGCPFFVWIRNEIKTSGTPEEQASRTRIILGIKSYNGQFKDAFSCEVVLSTGAYSWSPSPGTFDVESDEWDDSAKDAVARTIDGGTFSEAGIAQIRRRLALCLKSHKQCRQYEDDEIRPLRFIVLSSKDATKVRIKATSQLASKRSLPYVALSYCWGSDQAMKTTTSNLRRRESGIRVTLLPKTIQDAISVTRQLGLRLLWVDSLCILQDNADSVAEEINNMAHYYSNAIFTISAAAAKHCNEGFLAKSQDDKDHRFPGFRFPSSFDNPTSNADALPHLKLVAAEPMIEPIDTRAWTLQETLLSTRLVSFGTRRIAWSCRTATYGKTKGDLLRNEMSEMRNLASSGDALLSELRSERLFGLWTEIVEDYTSRALSLPEDRLSAISGVARMLAEFDCPVDERGDQQWYTAGLWNTVHFTMQLLWMPKRPWTGEYSSQYIAPSWSWASFPGAVYWKPPPPRATAPAKWQPGVIYLTVTPSNNFAPHGAVTWGVVKLEGRTFDPTLTTNDNIELMFDLHGKLVPLNTMDWTFWSPLGDLLCIEVIRYQKRVDKGLESFPEGLILQQHDDDTYQRVGVYFNKDPGVTSQTEPQIVDIV